MRNIIRHHACLFFTRLFIFVFWIRCMCLYFSHAECLTCGGGNVGKYYTILHVPSFFTCFLIYERVNLNRTCFPPCASDLELTFNAGCLIYEGITLCLFHFLFMNVILPLYFLFHVLHPWLWFFFFIFLLSLIRENGWYGQWYGERRARKEGWEEGRKGIEEKKDEEVTEKSGKRW